MEEWQGTLKAFRDNPKCCDEVWFSTGETLPPLAWHRDHCVVVKRAAEDIRQLGYGVSLQIEMTIGHGDKFPTKEERRIFSKNWTGWTCIDGTECKYCNCPRQPGFISRIAEVGAMYAQIKPDVIWIDDDLRTRQHYPATGMVVGCWCAKCLADFSAEEGVTWTREKLAEAWKNNNKDVRRRWLDFNARSLGEVAAAITRAVHKVSPTTRMGFQMEFNSFRDPEVRVIARAMSSAAEGKVSLRIGGGGYYDDNPILPLVKSQLMCEARERLALDDCVDNWCTELETYPRAYGSRSTRSMALESFTAIGWGIDAISLFVMDRRSEKDDFYSQYQLRPLVGINAFLHGYKEANRQTVPAGFSCPLGESEAERSRLLCGIPVLHGRGVSWGEINPEKEIIGGLGAGWGDLRKDLLPDWRKTSSAKIQVVRDFLSGNAPVVLKSPFVGYVLPRVTEAGELKNIGLVGTRLDPQYGIRIRVATNARRSVWHELGHDDVEVEVQREGDAAYVVIPSIDAWNCGYLVFQ